MFLILHKQTKPYLHASWINHEQNTTEFKYAVNHPKQQTVHRRGGELSICRVELVEMSVSGDLFKEDSSKREMQGLQDGKQGAEKCSNQSVSEAVIFLKDSIELKRPV